MHLQCRRSVHSAAVSPLTVYIAFSMCILHTWHVIAVPCVPPLHIGWFKLRFRRTCCTRTLYHPAPFAPSVQSCRLKLLVAAMFAHRTALLRQNNACVVHLCSQNVRIAAIFGHHKVSNQPHTARIATHGLTDGDCRGCFPVQDSWSTRCYCNDSLLLPIIGTLAEDTTCSGWRFAPQAQFESSAYLYPAK